MASAIWGQLVYPSLLSRTLLPIGEMLLGQHALQRLSYLRQAQWWPRERLQSARDAALRELVQVAYRDVAMHREAFDRAGVRPQEIRTAGDLRQLPITTKAMIRAAGFCRATRYTGLRTREECSSGSTGEPFRVLEDTGTTGLRQAAFLLSLEWAGWRLGEPHAQCGARIPRSMTGLLKDRFLRCYYFSALDLAGSSLDAVMREIDRRGIEHLWGFPCALRYLAERALATGWNRRFRSLVTWGDTVDHSCRQLLERAFGTTLLDTYGCGEGMQVAAQCSLGHYYHIDMLDTIVELVDERGEPVPTGVPGRVLLTRLNPGAMPFLRYEVGDIATSAGDRVCSCGREHELLESIHGRESDAVTTPSGKKLIVYAFARVFDSTPGITSWQAIQTGWTVAFHVVAEHPDPRLLSQLRERLIEAGLDDMEVTVEFTGHIPLTSGGKHRFVLHQ